MAAPPGSRMFVLFLWVVCVASSSGFHEVKRPNVIGRDGWVWEGTPDTEFPPTKLVKQHVAVKKKRAEEKRTIATTRNNCC